MRTFSAVLLAVLLVTPCVSAGAAPQKRAEKPEQQENLCIQCHRESDLWEKETRRLYVTEGYLAGDIHWQKGMRCEDCHGGDPTTTDFAAAHAVEAGFRSVKSPKDVAAFCGHCHSKIEYMRKYEPSPRTDQEAEYWTSGHGQRLKATGDPKVATCISCHDKPHASGDEKAKHGILAVDSLESPVYPTNVAKTCATCHSDKDLMADRKYHDRPISHDQYEKWRKSVHGEAMLKKGDLSAPTCNDCHGNHGAVPPQVDSVANACGACHGKVAGLFAETRMKHKFEEVGLPGCAACHGSHEIHAPMDEMLGMQGGAVCIACHEKGKFGATLAGADTARFMREGLERLKQEISDAEAKIAQAERLGMEVSGPRFDLRKADDALTNARSLIHSFSKEPVEQALAEGFEVTSQVGQRAQAALEEHTFRRIWLATALAPILVVILLLLLYIRTLPVRAP